MNLYKQWHRRNNKYDCLTHNITLTYLLTELSPSWKAANCAVTQELPRILWNPEVHCRVHNSLPLVHILSQIDPVHTIPPISLRSILILSTHLRLHLPSGLLPSGFSSISYMHFSSSPFVLHALPSYPPRLDHSNYLYVWRRAQGMKLLIHNMTLQCNMVPDVSDILLAGFESLSRHVWTSIILYFVSSRVVLRGTDPWRSMSSEMSERFRVS
jgi:hypothetical protein